MAFAGSVYPWHPLESVLHRFHALVSQPGVNLELRFFGTEGKEQTEKLIQEKYHALKDKVFFNARIPNSKLIPILKNQDLLLLFNDYSITGTKIFDYLAAKTCILLCYTNDEDALQLKKKYFPLNDEKFDHKNNQADIIKYTKSGYLIKDANELKVTLEALNQKFVEKGSLPCNSINIEEFSRKNQVKKLAEIVDRLS